MAELYALVFWLRHRCVLSLRTPTFYTDCKLVVDGWHGMWDVSDPWTPHRSLWQELLFLRADRRVDAQVVWVRGHSEMRARAQASCWDKYASAGNAAAHVKAQEAASWHPCQWFFVGLGYQGQKTTLFRETRCFFALPPSVAGQTK